MDNYIHISLQKLVFTMWKTGMYSKERLLNVLKGYRAFSYKDVVETVDEVLSNLDKYEIKFKQNKTEQFFIELLQLMEKYNVGIYAQSIGKDSDGDDDIRIFFETPDGTFATDNYYEMIDWDQTNCFEEVVDNDNDECRIYEFPAVQYFESEGIKVRN